MDVSGFITAIDGLDDGIVPLCQVSGAVNFEIGGGSQVDHDGNPVALLGPKPQGGEPYSLGMLRSLFSGMSGALCMVVWGQILELNAVNINGADVTLDFSITGPAVDPMVAHDATPWGSPDPIQS